MKNAHLKSHSVVNFSFRQRGASLLEGIAYLAVAALVILGAVSLLTSAFSSAQSNRASEEVVSIRTGVRKLYTGQSNSYGTVDITANLNTARIFPTTLTANTAGTTTTMNNSWGGAVTVTGSGGGSTFTIAYTLVPQDACINMISGASGWTQINVGGANAITTFPATPADANTACATATNNINFISR
ncbi:type 4 pilus major pilin [Undibacterium sp. SXout7W]|uniref:type 4 pilus major pilin n=1 Tax=Undibacterium sp. SXout7W TaxID=3413049 RepID=UPI003BF131CA